MGQHESKKKVRSIEDEVSDIRRSIRASRGSLTNESRDQLQRLLINYSQQVNRNGQKLSKKEIDHAQKLITQVSTELLQINNPDNNDNQLDLAAIESDSFIHQTQRERRLSSENSQKKDLVTGATSKMMDRTKDEQISTLDGVERKVTSIKLDLKVAIANNDKARLRFLKKSVENLATDLELIPVESYIVLSERKKNLEKTLQGLYVKIIKARKQMDRNSDVEYLGELHGKQNRNSEIIREIETFLGGFILSDGKSFEEVQKQKSSLENYRTKAISVEEISDEVQQKKLGVVTTLDELISTLDKYLQELSTKKEKNLKRMGEIESFLDDFLVSNDPKIMRDQERALINLKERTKSVLEISPDIQYRKLKVDNTLEGYLKAMKETQQQVDNNAQEIVAEKLSQAEQNFQKFQASLPSNPGSDARKKCERYLVELDSYVDKLPELTPKLGERKQKFHKTITESLEDLHKKCSEEPVVLRSKTSAKTVQDFYATWIELEPSLQPNSLTTEELCNSYNLLTTLATMINNKAIQLRNKINRTSITSNQETKDPVKVKVKITNSTPLRSSQLLEDGRLKHFYDLQEEINQLRLRIAGTSFLKGGQEYQDIKGALTRCQTNLHRLSIYEHDQDIVRNLYHSLDEAQELLETKTLSTTTSTLSLNRRSTSDSILNDLMEIRNKVTNLGMKFKRFGTVNHQEYQSLRNSLEECRDYLLSLNSDKFNPNLKKARDDILAEIQTYLTDLSNAFDNGLTEEQRVLRCKLGSLKRKVARFSGTYKNVLYNKIEADLKSCLVEVKDYDDLKGEIESNLKILEHKSVKDLSYVGGTAVARIEKIRKNLKDYSADLVKANTKDELLKLDNQLSLEIVALDNLTIVKDKEISDQRQQLYREINEKLTEIGERLNLIDKQPAQSLRQEFEKIRNWLIQIRIEIRDFEGDETSSKFIEIDESLTEATLKLDSFKIDMKSELYPIKIDLLRQIQNCCDLLEDACILSELEGRIKEMNMRIDSFSGCYGDKDYHDLDERLINLNVKLGKFEKNSVLEVRLKRCDQDIKECFKRLREAAGDKAKGTYV